MARIMRNLPAHSWHGWCVLDAKTTDEEDPMITPAILTIPTLVLPLLMSSPTRDCQFDRMGDPAADERALVRFESVVNEYVDLHRRLERAFPIWFISDLEQLESAAAELRIVLRDARPQAAQGHFFTSEVADVFRFRIGKTLRERSYNIEAMTSSTDDESGVEGWWEAVVNERLPLGGVGAFWPIFENLPGLPLELEYRLIGRDLVLLDVHANMVVDVLDLALPVVPTGPLREEPVLPNTEDTRIAAEDEPVTALDEEFIGCWYGEVRDFQLRDEQEIREH